MRTVLILSTIVLILSTQTLAHKPPSLEPDLPYGGYGLGGSADGYWASVWLNTVVVGGLITMAVLYNLNKDNETSEWQIRIGGQSRWRDLDCDFGDSRVQLNAIAIFERSPSSQIRVTRWSPLRGSCSPSNGRKSGCPPIKFPIISDGD